ncbi:hypothetical protein PMAYCL1PPCAC_00298, partial [Pristionchus mayeri]
IARCGVPRKVNEFDYPPTLAKPSITSMADEDPRTVRGGHRLLFDRASFPDAVTLNVRGEEFTVSASYLSLHSPFFYDLFHGPSAKALSEKVDLDCDPRTFGDLLDIIYPSYKKINCCSECTSSTEDRLKLAIELNIPFAIKRLRKENVVNPTESMPVSAKFPDAVTILVSGEPILVSASTLSLHSPILRHLLYEEGKLKKSAELDVDRAEFEKFIRVTTGYFPSELTSEFLNMLLSLQAKKIYDFYRSELNKKVTSMSSEEARDHAAKLLKHYANQADPFMDRMKVAVRHLTKDDLGTVLAQCAFLSQDVKEYLEQPFASPNNEPFTIQIKTLTGRTWPMRCAKGGATAIEDIKAWIQNHEGIPADHQRLIARNASTGAAKQMFEGMTLGDYDVE